MRDPYDPDELLVKALKRNKPGAYERLIYRFQDKVKRLIVRTTRDPNSVEDVLQLVWLRVFRKIHLFRGESKFSSWLYTVTFNESLLSLRNKKRARSYESNTVSENSFPTEFKEDPFMFPDPFLQRALTNAISRVSKEHKKEIALFATGSSAPDASKQLGITLPAYKSRLYRVRTALKQRLRQAGIDYKEAVNE